ncbi:cytochrome P450 9e2-like [Arctopsyche grandis]|uniref:cytochrome P450 9e2-like n=1 Tax=Arctopsyche grandis TaxID=121162 RepID=UPI00406D8682
MLPTIWDAIIVISSFIAFIYVYGLWGKNYFKNRGVKCLPFNSSIIGNMYNVLTKKVHLKDEIRKGYYKFSDQRYFGFMQLDKPMIVVRDLDVIRQITIKDFDHFQDHHGIVDEVTDPLFGKNLFALKGQKWREMRATLSPAFTSSKMRAMFSLVIECAEQLSNFYVEKMNEKEHKERGLIELEMKDTFTRNGNDVIASTAFGLKVDSLKDDMNEFYRMGKEATDFAGFQYIKILLFTSFPRFMKFTGMTLYKDNVNKFFKTIVTSAMREREKFNVVRPDMIHLLMEAKKGALEYDAAQSDAKEAGFATVEESNVGKQAIRKQWTDDDIIAQAILFLIAGFDTTATVLTFMAYELAVHPEIQQRLHEEIDDIIKEKGCKLDYDDLPRLKYLDMVLSETMRLWPVVTTMDRICNKTYKLPPPSKDSNVEYEVEPGRSVLFPAYSIQRDAQYFENPETFDPERFSDENKHKIKPFTYMPFGLGPRNCIGSRFALMETKAVIFFLLAKFNFVPTAKTPIPLVLSTVNLNLNAEKGFWLGFEPRVK